VLFHQKPDVTPGPVEVPETSDEFNEPTLGLQWEWNHNPVNDHWSLTERPGYLRLKALPAPDLLNARNTLTQMLADPAVTITTLLDTRSLTDHQKAGLCLFDNNPSWIGMTKLDGQCHLTFFADKTETIGPVLTQDTVQLQVRIAPDQTAAYAYSLDGASFTPLGAPAKIVFSWWKGARPGLFSYNTDSAATSPGTADFDWWHYQPASPAR